MINNVYDERPLWSDLWNLRKKYFDIQQGDDAAWSGLIQEIDDLSKKYNSTFANGMLLLMLDDLEQRSKIAAGRKPKHDDVRVAQFYKQLIKGAFDAETP